MLFLGGKKRSKDSRWNLTLQAPWTLKRTICSHSSIQSTTMIKICKGEGGRMDKEHDVSRWFKRTYDLSKTSSVKLLEEMSVSIDNYLVFTPFFFISLWIFCKVVHDVCGDIYVTNKAIWNISSLAICSLPTLTWIM